VIGRRRHDPEEWKTAARKATVLGGGLMGPVLSHDEEEGEEGHKESGSERGAMSECVHATDSSVQSA
jgi:hypothetical protein